MRFLVLLLILTFPYLGKAEEGNPILHARNTRSVLQVEDLEMISCSIADWLGDVIRNDKVNFVSSKCSAPYRVSKKINRLIENTLRSRGYKVLINSEEEGRLSYNLSSLNLPNSFILSVSYDDSRMHMAYKKSKNLEEFGKSYENKS